ncbi:tetratricopeptide repeat-containing glycosyltransferase family 2 protein [Dethiothermospora halolimnae]|uniref:tetratricopeptide repeat-containing glycosyltransferase family 2 protein n=1 Tax=Dethiothermospora halolimnae TaxID=3114390 RepID=UPI003CCBEB62
MKLSLCMIVKNEEKNLPRCLDSVKDIVDEMIIVDTGSTDKTIDIAKNYNSKVYYFKWCNNFSKSRNYSIEKAKGDWILIMDGDDRLEPNDKTSLLKLLDNEDTDIYFMQTLSYVGTKPGLNVVNNLNVRLIRNNKGYKFKGEIHEQLDYPDGIDRKKVTKVANIKFHHYGYLNYNIKEKNKRKRNIEILKEVLEKDSHNSFNLFNIGNEYFALEDYEKALVYYKKSYDKFNPTCGFSPKLIFRIIMCLNELNRYDEALSIINKGLRYYPRFTDLLFVKGIISDKRKNTLLTIETFNQCLKMGEPPLYLSFIVGVGSYRPHHGLAEIYYSLGEYDKAYYHYVETLKKRNDYIQPLYRIAHILKKNSYKIDNIKKTLEGFFGDSIDENCYFILSDIFFDLKEYNVASDYLSNISVGSKNYNKAQYYKALCLLYKKDYRKAYENFYRIDNKESFEDIKYKMALCKVLDNQLDKAYSLISKVKDNTSKDKIKVYNTFLDILSDKKYNPYDYTSNVVINIIFSILDTLLHLEEYDVFEKTLNFLNIVNDNSVLLRLGKLYYKHGHFNLAYKEFIRSIRLFNVIDAEGLEIMWKIRRCNLA